MLRLRSSILARLLSSPATYPGLYLHRLLSAAAPAPAPAVPPNPSFAVEEYLVDTCGLTRAQALKASTNLSHVKSPTNPDAVLAFLTGLGLSSADDVAAVVAKDPKFLCTSVERTLGPIVLDLTSLGLSRSEIARFLSVAPRGFRSRFDVSRVQYYLTFFGSFDNFLRALKFNGNLLTCGLERTVKPNIAILRESGLGDCSIAKLGTDMPRILTADPERVREIVACAEGIGVPRDSGTFRIALHAVAFLSKEKIAAKVDSLKKTFGWSDAEVSIAVCKFPMVLTKSKDLLQSKSEFLISEVGLEPVYIAFRPVMISYSLEGRLRPRYCVVKFLKENGLIKRDRDYNAVLKLTEKAFLEKLICPHKEAAPYLAEDYAAACRGDMPTRFRFTTKIKLCAVSCTEEGMARL